MNAIKIKKISYIKYRYSVKKQGVKINIITLPKFPFSISNNKNEKLIDINNEKEKNMWKNTWYICTICDFDFETIEDEDVKETPNCPNCESYHVVDCDTELKCHNNKGN